MEPSSIDTSRTGTARSTLQQRVSAGQAVLSHMTLLSDHATDPCQPQHRPGTEVTGRRQAQSPEQPGLRIPVASQDANDLAGTQVRVEVHYELRVGVDCRPEGLSRRASAARSSPVCGARHHLVLLLATQQQVCWRFYLQHMP